MLRMAVLETLQRRAWAGWSANLVLLGLCEAVTKCDVVKLGLIRSRNRTFIAATKSKGMPWFQHQVLTLRSTAAADDYCSSSRDSALY